MLVFKLGKGFEDDQEPIHHAFLCQFIAAQIPSAKQEEPGGKLVKQPFLGREPFFLAFL